MNGKTPTRKVTGGAIAGALSVVLIWITQQMGVIVPAEISSAVTTLITFATSYWLSDPE